MGPMTVDRTNPAYAGQAVYSRTMLRLYDAMVYRVNAPLFWRCRVRRLVELYGEHVSLCHLDIGVGTGYLLNHCRFPASSPEITLMDLNPNSLEFAARRLRRYEPTVHQGNVLAAWELSDASFESIAMCNVLHCVPGAMREKAVAFDHGRAALRPGGTLFGSTVLAHGVEHTRSSRRVLERMNRRGIFSNSEDSLEDLDAALARRFAWHEIEVHGAVALFAARDQVAAKEQSPSGPPG